MLDLSLLDLTQATALSGPNLARSLRKCASGQLLPIAKMREAILQDLQADYPRRFRDNDVERAVAALWPVTMLTTPELPMLDVLFKQLMQPDGDLIGYRDNQVQAYCRACARLDPSVWVGWHLIGRVTEAPRLELHDLARIVSKQQAFYAPRPVEGKPVAENHVHLGGAHGDHVPLLALLVEPYVGLKQDRLSNAASSMLSADQLAELRALFATLLLHCATLDNPQPRPEKRKEAESKCQACLRTSASQQLPPYASLTTYSDWASGSNKTDAVDLRAALARSYQDGNAEQAWLWFLLWLWRLYRRPHSPPWLRAALLYLVVSLHGFRRSLVMDGLGLTQFVRFYRSKGRQQLGKRWQTRNAIWRLMPGPEDLAELKFGPDRAHKEWLIKLAEQLAGTAAAIAPLTAQQHAAWRDLAQRWHGCFHFSRKSTPPDRPVDTMPQRCDIWNTAAALHKRLTVECSWHHWPGRGLPDDQLLPMRWIRGLDVAGDENATPTELYAPALRWLRTGLIRHLPLQPPTRGLHFSIHAGEDYAHPLSGLRRIDETVRFCEMGNGDRLGHALALGVDPKTWLEHHGDIVLPLDEHLDNLVWAWHYAVRMSGRLPLAGAVLPGLERRIQRFVGELDWTRPDPGQHVSPDQLHRVWQLRRNSALHLQNIRAEIHPGGLENFDEFALAAPDWKLLLEQEGPAVCLFWRRYDALFLRQPVKLMNVCVRHDTNLPPHWPENKCDTKLLLHDTLSDEELEFMHALQDFLLDEYDQIGLMIEANPTSNVYIARLREHAEHPIFRWYPPDESTLAPQQCNNRFGLRRGPIRVCVNTDDPGIMPTTLRTEFALLREAAVQSHGVSRTDAEAWVERLRQLGIDEFRRNHEPVFGRSL